MGIYNTQQRGLSLVKKYRQKAQMADGLDSGFAPQPINPAGEGIYRARKNVELKQGLWREHVNDARDVQREINEGENQQFQRGLAMANFGLAKDRLDLDRENKLGGLDYKGERLGLDRDKFGLDTEYKLGGLENRWANTGLRRDQIEQTGRIADNNENGRMTRFGIREDNLYTRQGIGLAAGGQRSLANQSQDYTQKVAERAREFIALDDTLTPEKARDKAEAEFDALGFRDPLKNAQGAAPQSASAPAPAGTPAPAPTTGLVRPGTKPGTAAAQPAESFQGSGPFAGLGAIPIRQPAPAPQPGLEPVDDSPVDPYLGRRANDEPVPYYPMSKEAELYRTLPNTAPRVEAEGVSTLAEKYANGQAYANGDPMDVPDAETTRNRVLNLSGANPRDLGLQTSVKGLDAIDTNRVKLGRDGLPALGSFYESSPSQAVPQADAPALPPGMTQEAVDAAMGRASYQAAAMNTPGLQRVDSAGMPLPAIMPAPPAKQPFNGLPLAGIKLAQPAPAQTPDPASEMGQWVQQMMAARPGMTLQQAMDLYAKHSAA